MTTPFVPTLIERDVLDSTSDFARHLIEAGPPGLAAPFVVRARQQTRGRGRGTNCWWSDPGSLTFTLALDPPAHGLRPEHEPRLALATAVAIIDAIAPLGLSTPPGIRWPNDIEAGGRKLGGILPERVESAQGPRLLIGVGLNVSTAIENAPRDVQAMATSLAVLRHGGPPEGGTDGVLTAILACLPLVLEQLARDDPALAARWAALDTLLDQTVRVDLGTRLIHGVGCGIDAEGALNLATAHGPVRLFGGRVLRAY